MARPPTHGLVALKAKVDEHGLTWLDPNSPVAIALRGIKAAIVEDLGGSLSAAQELILDTTLRTHLIVQSIDAYLLKQDTVLNAKRSDVLDIVKSRIRIVNSVGRGLKLLGLERKKAIKHTLATYVAEKSEPRK